MCRFTGAPGAPRMCNLPSAPSSAKAAPADTATAESTENKSVDKFAPLSNMTDDQAGWLGLAGLVAGTALVGYFTDGDPTMGFLKSLAVGASGGMVTDFAQGKTRAGSTGK